VRGNVAMRTVGDLIRFGARRLARAHLAFGHGTDNALDEAAYLVMHALALPVAQTARHLDTRVTLLQVRAALALLDRRACSHRPAAYLTREAWLGPYRFYVDERVIVPRSYLAEWIRDDLPSWVARPDAVADALELCTGSGALAVLLANSLPNARIDATDISPDALAVARRNVARYRLSRRVRLIRADLFAGLARKRYDLILANPPYVTSRAMARLPAEYRAEPQIALAGGRDGLDCVRRILARASRHLRRRGLLVVETGHARKRVERAFPDIAFTWVATRAGDDAVFLLDRDALAKHAAAVLP
jgi:ribosomal protein L3 glutamine methyltransferase